MNDKINKELLEQAKKNIKSQKFNEAIRLFYKLIKRNPDFEIKVQAYIGLGDVLRYQYELELAEKMYKKALILSRIEERMQLVQLLKEKIENNYVMKKEREIKPVQIEFFMRSVMKLLSKFGKTDWF